MNTPTPINPLVARAYARWKASKVPQVAVEAFDLPPLPQWTIDELIDWLEVEFWIPERYMQPRRGLLLDGYQKAALREALRRDEQGLFVYDLVLWSDLKKSAKSTIAGGVVLFRALHERWGSYKIVANDLEQADSRVFGFIKRAIELNPVLASQVYTKNYKIFCTVPRSTIQAVPVDPSGESGGNDDMIEYTELHLAQTKKAQSMWTETTLSPTKHGTSQQWIDTYAGHSGESPVLEPLYEKIVKEGRRLSLPGCPDDLEVYANGRMFALWNTIPRLPWQTEEYYASEAAKLLPNEFDRVHKNQWTSSLVTFVPGDWWTACRGTIPPFGRFREIVVAIDAAVTGDCFGIVGLSRSGDKLELRYCRKWTPPPGGKIEYSNVDNPEDVAYPEGELRRIAKEYNVVGFAYDPYQLHHLCTSLSNDNVGYFVSFDQGGRRLKADKQLYDLIRDRRFIHDGNPDLTEHIQNANARTEGDKLRIVKRSEKMKIDLAVCASMAADLAFELLPE